MSKCPYHQPSTTASSGEDAALPSAAPEVAKCPYQKPITTVEVTTTTTAEAAPSGHPSLDDLQEGQPMCSYARKALEARKAKEAQQAASASSSLPALATDKANWNTATAEEFKAHFTEAYDTMSTHLRHNKDKSHIAAVLMSKLGYTQDELNVIGEDVQLMQGTGNPHVLAALKPGEFVVDLGSGFGIDAMVMAAKVGATGRVVGIDLAANEVLAALKRVQHRQLRNVDFRIGDIESLPFHDNSIDCAMSNGGFCLVPRKRVAFEEIFRVLKPGTGRFSVSCTTSKKELDPTKDWPSCMVVFMPLATVTAMLTSIGFVDVVIDDSNSSMTLWDDEKASLPKEVQEDDGAKITIHRGEARYDFLKNLDMNEYFARVNIYARKP